MLTPVFLLLVLLTTATFLHVLVLAGAGGRIRSRVRARRRLQRLALDVHPASLDEEVSILRELRGMGPGPMGKLAARLRLLEPLRLLLHRAGRPMGVGAFLSLTTLLAAGGFFAGNVLLRDPRLALLLTASSLIPLLVVQSRKRRRMARFEAMLPQALDLLSRALRAGHAMSAGLQMVGEELDDPVGPEFAHVAEEVQFGLELPAALANLRYRIDVPDMPFFVTALIIQRETGGNLAEIIDGLAKVIRDRLNTEGKIRALTAQSRWSANILVMAPFVFLGAMSIFRKDYVAPLWETPAGNIVATVAAVLAVFGWVLCRRVGVVRV